MSRPAILRIDIIADAARAIGGADATGKAFGKLGGIGKAAALGVAGLGIAAGVTAIKLGKDALGAASDMGETLSKTQVLFGSASQSVVKFGDDAARSLGISKQSALDGAATFATFGKSAGLSNEALAGFSTQLLTAAGDMASFHNASPEETIQAIGAGLRGEAEPLRKFGILMDDASLRAEALKQGLVKTTREALTPQQKVLAAQALVLKGVGAATGDFERTSGSLSNQQKILAANVENTKTKLGQGLLPVATALTTFLNSTAFPAISSLASGLSGKLGPAITAVGGFITTTALPAARSLATYFTGTVVPAVTTFAQTVIAEAGPALRSLATYFTGTALPAIRSLATYVLGTLVPAFQTALRPVLAAIGAGIVQVTGTISKNRESFITLWNGIRPVVTFLAQQVAPLVGKTLGAAFRTWAGGISVAVSAIAGLIRLTAAAIDKVRELGRAISNSPVGKLGGAIAGLFSAPVLGMVSPVSGGIPSLRPNLAGLATAAAGDGSYSGSLYGNARGGLVVVDNRKVTNRIIVQGAFDPPAVARQIEQVLRDQAVRLGRAPALA